MSLKGHKFEIDEINLKNIDVYKFKQIFPEMSSDEYNALLEDISNNGIRTEISVIKCGDIYKLLDGRSRVKALLSLGSDTCLAKVYKCNDLSNEDIEKLIISYEINKNQSASMKAVKAWLYKKELERRNKSITQKEAANIFGADYRLVSIINNIDKKYKRKDILNKLIKGEKVNISNNDEPFYTDNLRAIDNKIKLEISEKQNIRFEELNKILESGNELTFVADIKICNLINKIKETLNIVQIEVLVNRLKHSLEEMKNS